MHTVKPKEQTRCGERGTYIFGGWRAKGDAPAEISVKGPWKGKGKIRSTV